MGSRNQNLIKIIFVLILGICAACASKTTSSIDQNVDIKDYQGKTFERCIFRIGYLRKTVFNITAVGAFYDFELDWKNLKNDFTKSLIDRKICSEVEVEKVENVDLGTDISVQDALKILSPKDLINTLQISLYGMGVHSDSVYVDRQGTVLWGVPWVLSLGFIPLGQESSMKLAVIVKKPNEPAVTREIEYTKWAWYWTPYYFMDSSYIGIDAHDKNNEQIRSDSINTILNGI